MVNPVPSYGNSAYPNDFSRSHLAKQLAQEHASTDAAKLEQLQFAAAIAGRLVAKASLGTASTGVVQDLSGRITIVVSDQATGKANRAAYASWQVGDLIGVDGILCRIPSGELALRAHDLRRLVKSTRPLPTAVAPGEAAVAHYIDLLGNRPRRMAKLRSRLVQAIREFLARRDYMEVETPILHPMCEPGVQQFRTHHNALDMELYLRRSAEPHLKRLLIGGIEQVFEINRSFTNAESGTPCEETALEICCAYTNDSYMMALLEALLTRATREGTLGDDPASDAKPRILRAPFARTTVTDKIRDHVGGNFSDADLRDPAVLAGILEKHGAYSGKAEPWESLQRTVFETVAAPRLVDPTFVVDFAADSSTCARRKTINPRLAEYFELFISGLRVAEGRSIQNDPEDPGQCGAGDGAFHSRELHQALEYGLPPASGVRLSIDRLILVISGAAIVSETVLFRT